MEDVMTQAPRGKILMGVPYYGLEFPTVDGLYNSTVRSDCKNLSTGDTNTKCPGFISKYRNVVDPIYDTWHNSSTIKWSTADKVRYYVYNYTAFTSGNYRFPAGKWQGYYDDARSLKVKYDYVISNQLGGVGIWALGYDNGYTELWGALREKFSKGPFIVVFKAGYSRSQQQSVHDSLGGEVVRYLVDDRAVIVRSLNKKSIDLLKEYRRRADVVSADFDTSRSLN